MEGPKEVDSASKLPKASTQPKIMSNALNFFPFFMFHFYVSMLITYACLEYEVFLFLPKGF